jgi:hypothetical protein
MVTIIKASTSSQTKSKPNKPEKQKLVGQKLLNLVTVVIKKNTKSLDLSTIFIPQKLEFQRNNQN